MKKTACFFLCCVFIFIGQSSEAQFGKLKEKIKQKVDQRVNTKTDQAIDKSLDQVENTVEGKDDQGTASETGEEKTKGGSAVGIKSYSHYDFIPGDKIIYSEDFSQDVVGEFPLKWNTDGSGEVVKVDGFDGKWLELQEATKYETPFKTALPDNYTLEFDILVEFKDDQFVPWIHTILSGDILPGHAMGPKMDLTLAPNHGNSEKKDGVSFESYTKDGNGFMKATDKLHNQFYLLNHKKTPVHVAIWVQKQRIRAWLNQEKVYDLPKGLAEGIGLHQLAFEVSRYGGSKENYQYFLSNLKIAVALPDTRSKLITEGKWSTTGILFDVNSDKIKPSSYGVLKEIAGTLTENPDVKVKIIGHTDSDGDDAKNLDLSKRRAAAVKAALSSEFSIDGSRIQTDGMGETKPVGDNKTPEGKAQNRRVEFIKL